MTETEKLRALLDERGAGYRYDALMMRLVCNARGHEFTATNGEDGMLNLRMEHLTAEQAVDAALGRWECELSAKPSCSVFDWRCDMCGGQFSTCDEPRYCPSCGARVKEGDDV